MATRFSLPYLVKKLSGLAVILVSVTTLSAQAAFINFDDLTYVPAYPEMPHFADTPVTNQYESLGLVVSDGYLMPYDFFQTGEDPATDPNFVSGPNYLQAGNEMSLFFVGPKRPTHVSMYVSSYIAEAIFLEAYGSTGLLGKTHTSGYAGPFDESPYVPKQYVSFDFAEGIQQINLWGFWGSRVSGVVDDLTFTYAEVPEPSPLTLLLAGIAVMFYRWSIIKKNV